VELYDAPLELEPACGHWCVLGWLGLVLGVVVVVGVVVLGDVIVVPLAAHAVPAPMPAATARAAAR
jgi:hypothetical protein